MTDPITRQPAGQPDGGQFSTHDRAEGAIALVPDYLTTVLTEIEAGTEVGAIAERDSWTSSQWERFYDRRGRTGNCPDCGRDIDEDNSSDDGICFRCLYKNQAECIGCEHELDDTSRDKDHPGMCKACADESEWFWCRECGELTAEDGEGYDGMCGDCADRAENVSGICSECGDSVRVDENGVSNHLDNDGEIDHDVDADHTAILESVYGTPPATEARPVPPPTTSTEEAKAKAADLLAKSRAGKRARDQYTTNEKWLLLDQELGIDLEDVTSMRSGYFGPAPALFVSLRAPHATGGYNEIIVGDNGIATFRLDSVRHRADGPIELNYP